MLLSIIELVVGLGVLAWSADRFVMGAASAARSFGVSPLLVGMLIIGFGTSVPEMVVSAFASAGGNPELALGNAFGSNIANIALILGVTALIAPVVVHRGIVRQEIPVLLVVTAFVMWLFRDHEMSTFDAVLLLVLFGLLLTWSIWNGIRNRDKELAEEVEKEVGEHPLSRRAALSWTFFGLAALVVSSHYLVRGAVGVAEAIGISDLVIGLTVVAVGTSLPELASAIAATRHGESELVLGNIIGSCLFNALAVVGIAGSIHPTVVDSNVLYRDLPVLLGVTVVLGLFGFRRKGNGRIGRPEGFLFLVMYFAYAVLLLAV